MDNKEIDALVNGIIDVIGNTIAFRNYFTEIGEQFAELLNTSLEESNKFKIDRHSDAYKAAQSKFTYAISEYYSAITKMGPQPDVPETGEAEIKATEPYVSPSAEELLTCDREKLKARIAALPDKFGVEIKKVFSEYEYLLDAASIEITNMPTIYQFTTVARKRLIDLLEYFEAIV